MAIQDKETAQKAAVGILMLETQFPRILGDVGHPETWNFPVEYRVIQNASPDRVVRKGAAGLLPAFIETAQELIADGADGITTTCGFLSLFQDELCDALGVPVATSSLMQVRLVNALLPRGKVCGVLTISDSALTPQHLHAAHVPLDTPIGSTEGLHEFTSAILSNRETFDVAAARDDNIEAARKLLQQHPNIGALCLECTNMVPYAADICDATGVPVFTMVSFVNWFQSGLTPRRY